MSTLDPRDRTQMSVEDIYHDLKAKLGEIAGLRVAY